MKRLGRALSVAVLILFAFAPGSPAQQAPGTMSPPIQILLTGCLRRSNSGGYRLTDQNGTTWELTSHNVNLAEHVFHAVSVTGKPTTPATPQNDKSESNSSPSRSLQVLTLKVLSPSCTR